MKVGIYSNVNQEGIFRKIKKEYDNIKIASGYGNWYLPLIEEDIDENVIFIILDGYELFRNIKDIDNEIDNYSNIIQKIINKNKEKNIFISNIDYYENKIDLLKNYNINRDYIEYKWSKTLNDLNKEYSNLYIFDLKKIILNNGRNMIYSKKLWYLGGMKYSNFGENCIVEEMKRILKFFNSSRKKCLVLDLDNTLWGGVIGDLGEKNIELSEYKEGARYKDFQKRIKELKELGILLAINSKNDYENVKKVFIENKDMVLKEDDFIIKKINWNPKSQNILEISQELNIGLDSIVFLDDNPIERDEVRNALPEVIVPEFPNQTSELEDFIIDIYEKYFFTVYQTNEDKTKTKMYFDNIKRNELRKNSSSIDQFLTNLDMKIYLWKMRKENFQRVFQLIHKTNQFNLTTKRYTMEQLEQIYNDEKYEIFIADVEDKYGDNGIVFLLIAKKEKSKIIIDSLIMSCRVMGRYIEDKILSYLENKWFEEGYKEIIGEYIKTEKNKPVENLFDRLGYNLIYNDGEKKEYSLTVKVNRKNIGELILK